MVNVGLLLTMNRMLKYSEFMVVFLKYDQVMSEVTTKEWACNTVKVGQAYPT
jgi:hypothetical protein